MTGRQKFLAVATYLSGGDVSAAIRTADVVGAWRRTELAGTKYNPAQYSGAQKEGWVNPEPQRRGTFCVTEEGVAQIRALAGSTAVASSGTTGLQVFEPRTTHTFDNFLRSIFATAQREILIIDPYVDETIFDTVLMEASKQVSMKLLYSNDRSRGAFLTRARRFQREYPKFESRKTNGIHDRLIVVDDRVYILGPSLKDAATRAPATVGCFGEPADLRRAKKLFRNLW